MTAIRTISVFALMTALAGCAGTQQDIATAPVKPGDEQAAKPVETGSDTVASLADSFGSDVNLPEQVSPAPAMVDVGPIDRQATAEIPVQPQYEPIEVVRAVPEPLPLASYDATVYEPAYQSVAAAPLVEPATTDSRSMAPIYDDPVGASSSGNRETRQHARKTFRPEAVRASSAQPARVRSVFTPQFGARLETAALGRLNPGIRYDARYVEIGYPWGDVPGHTGVCTDVVIRSYRTLGVDLQQLVHEDMRSAFNAYPSQRIYGLKSADPNIDHRRVVNLEAFFERTGAGITVGSGPDDFQPGDVLTWRLSGNEPHIGIVVSERDRRTGYPLVVHNLGAGVRKDDLITLQTPVGHYRFAPDTDTRLAQLSRGSRKTGS